MINDLLNKSFIIYQEIKMLKKLKDIKKGFDEVKDLTKQVCDKDFRETVKKQRNDEVLNMSYIERMKLEEQKELDGIMQMKYGKKI